MDTGLLTQSRASHRSPDTDQTHGHSTLQPPLSLTLISFPLSASHSHGVSSYLPRIDYHCWGFFVNFYSKTKPHGLHLPSNHFPPSISPSCVQDCRLGHRQRWSVLFALLHHGAVLGGHGARTGPRSHVRAPQSKLCGDSNSGNDLHNLMVSASTLASSCQFI